MSTPYSALFEGTELAIVGAPVTAITMDSNIVIFAGDHREHEIRIEADIEFDSPATPEALVVRYDPYNRQAPIREHLTELASIVSRRVVHAYPYSSGVLKLELDDGTTLTVEPLDRYEAWMYTFGNYILACPPGGFDHE